MSDVYTTIHDFSERQLWYCATKNVQTLLIAIDWNTQCMELWDIFCWIYISCVSSYLSESGDCSELNMKLDGSYVLQPSFSIQYRGSLLHCQIYTRVATQLKQGRKCTYMLWDCWVIHIITNCYKNRSLHQLYKTDIAILYRWWSDLVFYTPSCSTLSPFCPIVHLHSTPLSILSHVVYISIISFFCFITSIFISHLASTPLP